MEQQEMFMVDFQNDNDADLILPIFITRLIDLNCYKDNLVTCL